jgi:hypothetical protein
MRDETRSKLEECLRGPLVDGRHSDYDEVRKLYNGMIDKRPRLIAHCLDAADVIASVNFGRDNGPAHGKSAGAVIAVRGWEAAMTASSSTCP